MALLSMNRKALISFACLLSLVFWNLSSIRNVLSSFSASVPQHAATAAATSSLLRMMPEQQQQQQQHPPPPPPVAALPSVSPSPHKIKATKDLQTNVSLRKPNSSFSESVPFVGQPSQGPHMLKHAAKAAASSSLHLASTSVSSSLYPPFDSQSRMQQQQQHFAAKTAGVCSFLFIQLDMSMFTPNFARAALQWMREGPIYSLRGQSVTVFVNIKTGRTPGMEKLQMKLVLEELDGIDLMININGEAVKGGKQDEADARKSMHEMVLKSPCTYVSQTRLDADDILNPKFFEALDRTLFRDFGGEEWLGGFYAFRNCVDYKLMLGGPFSYCNWSSQRSKSFFYAGCSLGQTLVLLKDVFLRIGFGSGCAHKQMLNCFRKHVVKAYLLDADWKPMSSTEMERCSNENCDDSSLQSDQNKSRVFLQDLSDVALGIVPPGIYVISPLSSHFPWDSQAPSPRNSCDEKNGSAVQNHFSTLPLDHYFEASSSIFKNVSIYDSCESNRFFRKWQESLFKNAEEGCSVMAARFENVTLGKNPGIGIL